MSNRLKYVDGDLIKLAIGGHFDLIGHGCNCFCVQAGGIAAQMAKQFQTTNPDFFPSEGKEHIGDYNKLGNIEAKLFATTGEAAFPSDRETNLVDQFYVVNMYTQYNYGRNSPGCNSPADDDALAMCLKKINYLYKDKIVGLPKIASDLGGLPWDYTENLIATTLTDVHVIIVNYKK